MNAIRDLLAYPDAEEPMCWWLKSDLEKFKSTLQISGPRKGWFGRWYMDYYSPANGNIYGESFSWSERCNPPEAKR